VSGRDPRQPPGGRLHEIDLLRFVAAGLVLVYHYGFFGPATGLIAASAGGLDAGARYGGLGVNLFFIISGFVILMAAERSSPRAFIVSRAVRLYPAYWVCVTATFLGLLLLPHPHLHVSAAQYLANLTMVAPVFGVEYLDGVYWSLVVELRFYLLVFLLLLCGLLRHMRVILGIWLAASWLAHYHLAESHVTNLLLVTDWSSYFIAGAICYHVRSRGRWDWYSGGIFVLAGVIAVHQAVMSSVSESRQLGTWTDPRVVIALIVVFLLAFYLIAGGRTVRWQPTRLLAMGGLTYPLYLLHQRLGYALLAHVGRGWPSPLRLGSIAGVAIVTAYLVNRFVEPPLAARLRRILSAAARPITPPVGARSPGI
jgi:peptidoglycan/LPS O-acetylase OafA/YrhL